MGEAGQRHRRTCIRPDTATAKPREQIISKGGKRVVN
jgi:hypothetical protein